MKYVNKIIASVAILALSFYWITYSGDLGVNEIKVIDDRTLSVTLSENPNLEIWEIEAEITILNDVDLRWGFMVEDNAFGVELLLENALMPNTTYSLLSVSGAEGSIDFTTGQDVEWFTADNIASSEDQDVDSVEVIDDRTILIEYRQELTSSSFEYKLLAESNIVKIEKPDYFIAELIISVEPPFISEQDYILMFIDIQDVEGNYLQFDTGIYDFTTPDLDIQSEMMDDMSSASWSEDTLGEEITEDILEVIEIDETNTISDDNLAWELEVELEAAWDEISLEKDGKSEIDTLEVAGLATETPDTGAQTWVLIFLTLVINSFYYLSRRKTKLWAL